MGKVMLLIMFMAVYFKPGSAQNLARSCGPTGAGPCTATQGPGSDDEASKAIDGNLDSFTQSFSDDTTNAWWRVDFGRQVQVGRLKVYNRVLDADCCGWRLEGFSVFVGNTADNPLSNSPCATDQPAPDPAADVVCNTTLQGQYLFIRKGDVSKFLRPNGEIDLYMNLCEVEVFPPPVTPRPNLARMCGKDGKQACKAVQSSNNMINTFSVASNAIDGVISQNDLSTCSQTSLDQQDYSPWWRVDFGRQVQVTGLQVYSSAEGPDALDGFNVYVGNNEVLYSPTGPGPVLLNTPCEIDQHAPTAPFFVVGVST
jgi:hypothetical protein